MLPIGGGVATIPATMIVAASFLPARVVYNFVRNCEVSGGAFRLVRGCGVKEPKMASGVKPSVVSMLICDQVIDDKITNKKSAIGLFNIIMVPKLPMTIPQIAVLISVTEIAGPSELELRLVRDSDNEVIFQTRGKINAPDPLATVDLVFAMQGLKLPQAGQHAFEVLSDNEILSRRRFHIRALQPGQKPDAPPGTQG